MGRGRSRQTRGLQGGRMVSMAVTVIRSTSLRSAQILAPRSVSQLTHCSPAPPRLPGRRAWGRGGVVGPCRAGCVRFPRWPLLIKPRRFLKFSL